MVMLFPAQAGVIPRANHPPFQMDTVPRASGGDPPECERMRKDFICSPRKRG